MSSMSSKGDEVENFHRPWYKHITVEPSMFFYMMAFMVTGVVEQTFYVFRACTVDHGYSEEICYNINNYKDINTEVQKTTAVFHQWNGVANNIVPLMLAFFLGAYSDKRGRKVLIVAGLLGKLYFSAMITINTMNAWPLEYVIYTATFPSALTGADLAIFTGCFAYVADVSSLEDRTLRVGILDAVYLSTMPTGIALGNLLFYKAFDKSFTAMFAVNTGLMAVATVYSFLCLEWQTRKEQTSLREAGVTNPVADFFNSANVKRTIETLTKKRSSNRRLFLWLLFISMAFYTFQREEKPIIYMYATQMFNWDVDDFSKFRIYLSTAYVLVMLLGIPLMTKVFRWRDTVIIMASAASHTAGHLVYANAGGGGAMYAGATVAALGPCVVPLLRAIASKLLQPAEKGVAYVFLCMTERATALAAAVLYARLYAATVGGGRANAFLYCTAATQAVVLLLALIMHLMLRGERLEASFGHEERRKSVTSSS